MDPQQINATRHSKVPARFNVRFKPQIELPFKGILHLFEHEYNRQISFWYGVAQLECTFEDFIRPGYEAVGKAVIVFLGDRRQGTAECFTTIGHVFEGTTYAWLALSGVSQLCRPEDLFSLKPPKLPSED
jgi:hypothetical protein